MMSKMLIIILTVLFLAGILFLLSFKFSPIEMPDYRVLKTIGKAEIRQYPKMVVAKTNLSGPSFKENSSRGFRTIAGYIFGGNDKKEKIAMTAPVVMQMGDTASMYFVMPGSYTRDRLPKPGSPEVQIVEEIEKTLAVVCFSGYANDKKISGHCRELEQILKENGIASKGSFLFMGYNAPWDAFNRRNEVAIEVLP
jgi:hypothetical protein